MVQTLTARNTKVVRNFYYRTVQALCFHFDKQILEVWVAPFRHKTRRGIEWALRAFASSAFIFTSRISCQISLASSEHLRCLLWTFVRFPDSTYSASKTVTGWTVEETLKPKVRVLQNFSFNYIIADLLRIYIYNKLQSKIN